MWCFDGSFIKGFWLLWKKLVNLFFVFRLDIVAALTRIVGNILNLVVRGIHIRIRDDYNLRVALGFNSRYDFPFLVQQIRRHANRDNGTYFP